MQKKISVSRFSAIALAVIFSAIPAWTQRKADISRLVVVGDSLSAGYQNGSLLDVQQVNGYASLIAAQKDVPLAVPLIATPGIPNVLVITNPGPPPVTERAPGVSSGRVNPVEQAFNLAVPGANVRDALATRPDCSFDDMTDFVLGLPGCIDGVSKSQVEWAEALAPSTIILWIGNNDALGAAIVADTSALTPATEFEAAYHEIADRLAATGATLVFANIPDVTVVPYLTPAEDVAEMAGAPLAAIGPALGIGPGDYVTPEALPFIEAILVTGTASGPLPDGVVLKATEVAAIRAAIAQYNQVIAAEAAAKGAALVDINALTARLQHHGFVAGGQRLTTEFLGGLFSLDGIHPTNTGYALFANEFIHALNTEFAAGIRPVNVEHIKAADPLVPVDAGRPASALGHVSPQAVNGLRALVH